MRKHELLAMKEENVTTLPLRRPRRRRLLMVVSIVGVLLLLIAILLGSFAWWSGNLTWLPGMGLLTQAFPTPVPEIPISVEHRIASQEVAQQYMTALLKHQYKTMWSLLYPQVQAMWPNEAAFANFWRVRFQDYTLQAFTLGRPHGRLQWVNQETMVVYHQVILIPISLEIQPNPTLEQQAGLPPEDLYPSRVFQNLPFVVQQVVNPANQQSHWLVLDGGPADLEAPILPPMRPVDTLVKVPILMYHHISNVVPVDNLLQLSLTVTQTHFAQQLDYLKKQGYHTITFNQLFAALYYGGPLPSHPIILTFDDGYEDAYQFAFPLLQAHGFSGMFYIITGVVGWKDYLNWDQIRAMQAAGMQIGSHTIHHVNIGTTFLFSPQQAQEELQQSQAVLHRNLGIVIQQFCYPSGQPFRSGSLALRQRIVALLAEDSYVGATTDPGMTGIYQSSLTPFALLRIRVDGRESFSAFIQNLPVSMKHIVSLAP